MTLPSDPRRLKAERMRRYRARQRRGQRCANVPISNEAIELLMALRWLRDDESEDSTEIGKAIGAFMEDTARNLLKK